MKRTKWKANQVSRNTDTQVKKKKKAQKKLLSENYNKLKIVIFKDEEAELNTKTYTILPKKIIQCNLSKSALAVYPVMIAQVIFKKGKSFQISQANIAGLSGLTTETVKKALDELVEKKLLKREMITDKARHYYVYKILGKNEIGIPFHTCIIDNGIWAELKPRSKALYLSTRLKARQDMAEYSDETGIEYEYDERNRYLKEREWDRCRKPLIDLCKIVNISLSAIQSIIAELEEYGLIEKYGKCIQVYLKPKKFIKH